jgi:hypothetical protein
MLEDNKYESPSIEGHETAVKNRVVSFVESEMGETVDEQRINLPKLKNYLHSAVDFVMNDLPSGVERVDGKVIKPVLIDVIQEKISVLPKQEVEEV